MSATHFPSGMYDVLEEAEAKGHAHIISWCSDGRSFRIHDPDQMINILNRYFVLTKYKSFLRQLQAYGFKRVNRGEFKGTCSHPLLIRGKRFLCLSMKRKPPKRKSLKASKFPLPSRKVSEDNFHSIRRVSLVGPQDAPIVNVEDQDTMNFDWSSLETGRDVDQSHGSLGKSNLMTILDPPKECHMLIPSTKSNIVPEDYSPASDVITSIIDDIDDEICNYFTESADVGSNNNVCPTLTHLDVGADDDDWLKEFLGEGCDVDFDKDIFRTPALSSLNF